MNHRSLFKQSQSLRQQLGQMHWQQHGVGHVSRQPGVHGEACTARWLHQEPTFHQLSWPHTVPCPTWWNPTSCWHWSKTDVLSFSNNHNNNHFSINTDLLSSWVLELGPPQSLNNLLLVSVLGTDGHDDLTDVDTSNGSLGLTKSTSHSSLEPISSSTGQHFVDPNDMEGMWSDPHVESILTTVLDKILVGADTTGLQSFRWDLFPFIRNQVDTQWELINLSLLPTKIEDLDLWVWRVFTRFRTD